MPSPIQVCQIPGNSDIAGIGVRASVYIQACLAGFNLLYLLHTLTYTGESNQAPTTDVETQSSQSVPATTGTRLEGDLAISNRPSSPTNTLRSPERDIQNFLSENAEYLGIAKALERSLFMVGFAVILSAILEAKSSTGLSAYHAVIVLNISQINNWAGFLLLLLRGGFRTSKIGWIGHIFVTRRSLMSSLLCIAHSTVMSGLGLYFWSDLTPFLGYAADAQSCQPLTYFWLFRPIDVANNALRISSLTFYAISLVPIFGLYFLALIPGIALVGFTLVAANLLLVLLAIAFIFAAIYFLIVKQVIVFICRPILQTSLVQNAISCVEGPLSIIAERLRAPFLVLHRRATGLLKGPSYSPFITFTMAIFFSTPLIYSIISTEFIIRINRDNVEPKAESKWTYGQTLALFTALVAISLYMNELLKMVRSRRRRRTKYLPRDFESEHWMFSEQGTQT